MKKHLITLILAVTVLHSAMIGGFYALHIPARAAKTQQVYAAVWIVLTLIVVTMMMKRIRQARRRR